MRLSLDSGLRLNKGARRELQGLSRCRVVQVMPRNEWFSLAEWVLGCYILLSKTKFRNIFSRLLILLFLWTFSISSNLPVVRNRLHVGSVSLLFGVAHSFSVLLTALATVLCLLPDHLTKLKYIMSDIVKLVLHIVIVILALAAERTLYFKSQVYDMPNSLFVVLFVDARKVAGELGYLTDQLLHFIIQKPRVIYISVCLEIIQFMESLTNTIAIPAPDLTKENVPDNTTPPAKKEVPEDLPSTLNIEQNDKSISNPNRKSAFGTYIKEEQNKPQGTCKSECTKPTRRRMMKKPRKIRTLITKEKLLRMNKIFAEFANNQSESKKNMSLKEIASILQLGYSTILHKYRQYRANKKVKAGALIASMQKKRKYKKSLEVENLIQKSMSQMEFYTATEVTEFIYQNYGKKFSRSIISRHLGQMGFSYKNVTGGIHANNGNKLEKIKKIYAQIMWPLIQTQQTLIYFDQLSCCVRGSDPDNPIVITVVIAASEHGVLYFHLQDGFVTREKFFNVIKQFLVNLKASSLCRLIQGDNEQIYIVADLDSVHRDSCQQESVSGLAPMLIEQNAQILYIPPHSPEFNPLEQVFAKIKELLKEKIESGEVHDYDTLWQGLDSIMQATRQDNIQDEFSAVNSEIASYIPKRYKIDC